MECRDLALLIFVFSFFHNDVSGFQCECVPGHPQQDFCDADFVIKATVQHSELIPNDYPRNRQIKVKVSRYFKGGGPDEIKLHTFGDKFLCGVNLIPKQQYLITGKLFAGQHLISTCDWIEPWKHINDNKCVIDKLHNKTYERNCNCKVQHCREPCKIAASQGCRMNLFEQKDLPKWNGVCSSNGGKTCMWTVCTTKKKPKAIKNKEN